MPVQKHDFAGTTRRSRLPLHHVSGLVALLGMLFAPLAVGQESRRQNKPGSWPTLDARGDAVPSQRLNALLAPIRERNELPGLLGAIVQGRTVVAIGAVGLRKLGTAEPLTVNDTVHVGSCTKAMTATLLGKLVEAKTLSWSSTLLEVFPEYRESIHPDYQAVTLDQLLSHRAGLPRDVSWRDFGPQLPTASQRRKLLRHVCAKPPEAKPGSKHSYSNVGYVIAGLMAEQRTGVPWEDLITDELFRPLGMSSAGFGAPGTFDAVSQPWGHRLENGRLEPEYSDNVPALGPAGTVHCTLTDWARFVALHLQGARPNARFLAAATFAKMHTPPADQDYAYGWEVVNRNWAGGKALTHKGTNRLWYSTGWIAPGRNFAVLTATNCGGDAGAKGCDEAAVALIGHYREAYAPRR